MIATWPSFTAAHRSELIRCISDHVRDNFRPLAEGVAKARLSRFRSMNPTTFIYHLRACKFRFNLRGQCIFHALLTLCRNNPLSES